MPQTQPVSESASFGPPLEGAETTVFKKTAEVDLRLHIFAPQGNAGSWPAIVFFFGGGWQGGSPGQFQHHCRYLAVRGMLAACAEYRVFRKHGTSPFECVADGKSAVRWLRAHSNELGIDPGRIAAGGGSAGGHVAACTGVTEGLEEPGADLSVSSIPDALALFNPVLDTTETGWPGGRDKLGERCRELSPVHHLKAGAPPTIIFQGTADTTTPFENARRFQEEMQKVGSRCEVVPFEGMVHGFFNYGKHDNVPYTETVRAMDCFLTSLGFLDEKAL